MDIQSQIASLRTVQKCVYLAAEASPAEDISNRVGQAADTMQLMLAVCEAANRLQNEVHGSLQYIDREITGNTNYACLQTAAIVTREALAALEKSAGEICTRFIHTQVK
jgi:hypothetical protein